MVPVTATIRFPAPGLPVPGRTPPLRRSDLEMNARIADPTPTYRGFGFDEPRDIVPGTWRFEFRLGDALLATREVVVKAE